MAYRLGAYVLNMKKGGGDAAFDATTIGIWPGREVTEDGHDGHLIAVTNEFQSMEKSHPGKSKPMFVAWNPAGSERMTFKKFRGAILHMRVQVIRKTDQPYPDRWMLYFHDMKIIRLAHLNKVETVEMRYKKFDMEKLP